VEDISVVTAQKQKRVRRKPGDIVRIELGEGRHAYAQVADAPLMIFFDGTFEEEVPVEQISKLPVAFRFWVYNHAITRGTWPVIGSQPLAPANAEEPFFYKQDVISGRLALYHSTFAATNYERPASLEECQHLECAAVWEPEHAVDRLNDHAARRSNRWAESLKINTAVIPI
jgi:hypothetical protein